MKVVFVVGPTASGKSELALRLAEKFQGAIVNCDSIQLYQSLNIGSAKPSPEEFKRVPHFMFDVVPEGQEITAGWYQRNFFETLKQLEGKFSIVFVVGGTGFYFQAIEKGMYPIGAANPEIQKQVEAELEEEGGAERLFQELSTQDPVTAKKISPNDHYRIGRAVEMMRTHGRAVSEIKKEFDEAAEPFPYPLLKLGIKADREKLTPRVELRTRKMLDTGLLDEVRGMIAKGLREWSPLLSVGYKECLDFLEGRLTDEKQLFDLIVQNTLRLAKRQRTWFQRDTDIQWISPESFASSEELVAKFLKN